METLIGNATSTFQATIGLDFSAFIDFVVEQGLLILGMALGLIQALMPLWLSLAALAVILGLIWAFFRFWKLRH